MTPQDVKITTTSGFDNAEITEYLYPITAHVVVGMNFFKDFFSGFSDFFGGKSKSYQNTLRNINQEVIKELQKKAHSIGANCVLSMKIDNDEVSAQNKSMMMVTALGTAAKADFRKNQSNAIDLQKIDTISNEQMLYLKKRKEYLEQFAEGSIKLNDEFWTFAKTNQVKEFVEPVLNAYLNKSQNIPEAEKNMHQQFTAHLKEFLQVIDQEYLEQFLYARLNEQEQPIVHKRILQIIIDLSLANYQDIKKLFQGEFFYQHKNAVKALKADKQQYNSEDVEKMDELINMVSTQFPERGEITTRKKGLSGKEKEIWICECRKENDMGKTYCDNCDKDIYGFERVEFKPRQAVEKLINEVELLRETFS